MSKFLSYIHNLRGVAILFVVGVHARGNAFDWSSHPVAHDILATLFDSQEGNGTVMFLFIGGFLFQHIQKHRFDFKKYIQQKFKVIILPYILISIPLIIFRIVTHFQPLSVSEDFVDKPFIYQFFYHLLAGTHMAPFWFISTIILFYLTAPLLHALDRPFFYKFVFPIIFVAGLFTYRSFHNGNPLLLYIHYLPVYIAGMWASVYKDRIFSMDLKYFWILIAAYLAITFFEFQGAFTVARDMTFEQLLSDGSIVLNMYLVRTVILCFAISMLFYYLQFVRMPFLEILAEYSFGIYFVHFILIIVGRKLLEIASVTVDFSIITFGIFLAIITATSVLIVFVVKKLTGPYSRNLIGS